MRIIRENYHPTELKEDGTRRVIGREDITEGCKLMPFYDVHHQDKKRIVFRPGVKGEETNVGVKYIDGRYAGTFEAQPGFIITEAPLKRDVMDEAMELDMNPNAPVDDPSQAESLEGETESGVKLEAPTTESEE